MALAPNEAAARDFLAVVKVALTGDYDLMREFVGGMMPRDVIHALVQGAVQHAALVERFTDHDRAISWVDEMLAGFAARPQ